MRSCMYRVLIGCCCLVWRPALSQSKFVFERPEMGSPFTISIYAQDSLQAATVADKAFALADSLNAHLSDYIEGSEINRLSATAGHGNYISVSGPLFDILRRSQEAAIQSQGSYDVTIGPLVRLWRKARKTGVLPPKDSIRAAQALMGYRYMHLDENNRSVWLEKPGMRLDIGGLGKGFVAAAALDLITREGFPSSMVNAGGKIVAGMAPPGRKGWLIAINAPGEKQVLMSRMIWLRQMAVATSGDIYQYVEFNGRRYSHIVDPRTGMGLTRRRNVTAIAADGTTADWLATACSILSWRRSLRLIKHFSNAALLVTEQEGEKIRARYSPGFSNYLNNPESVRK